ncbi:DUF349 domain-containing protein [Flavobacterium sp.]|jgi:hypothetical protein|uniref:DUF349 domain-containing protein n=1 Tax=Flavobacterium sp. TaxID=239 RepID=UPI0037BFC515
MLEEKNDNLSPIENETDGNQENVSQNDIQEVIEITDNTQPVVDESVETVKEMNSETIVNEVTEAIEAPESVELNEVVLEGNEVVEEAVATISAQELAEDSPMSENGHQIALNAIDESNAEESEDETLKERHNIPMLEYASLSMEALVDELEKLTEVEKVMSVKEHVEEIKKEFLAKYHHFIEEKRDEFKAENPDSNEDFEYHLPLKSKFDTLYKQLKGKQNAHFKSLQNNLSANLERRLAIVEEIKNLINPQENIKDTLKHFNELREEWRTIGPIPRDKYNHVWNNYHFHVENFYDYLHLDREARDQDFKHNLELKQKIIARVEELVNEVDITKAFRELQDLHRIWKEEIGPVDREHREEIWNQFSALTKQMHDKREGLFTNQREKETANLENKKEIIAEIEKLATEEVTAHSQWQGLIEKVEALRNAFFSAGKVPSEINEATWAEFKTAVRNFNSHKNSFYKDIKKEQNDNLSKKMALVEKAKTLSVSEDFAATTPLMKQIQEEWKQIGHVPRKYSDKVWKEFKDACNQFFDRMKATRNEANSDEIEAFDKKKEYLEQLKEFQLVGDHKTDLDAIKAHIEQWKSYGKVPFSRRHIEGKFNKILDALFEKLSMSKKESDMMRFSNKLGQLAGADDSRKLEGEKIFIMRKIDELQSEIFQLENNIQFFTHAKKDNPMVKEVFKNIEKHKDELKTWRDKLKQLRNISHE